MFRIFSSLVALVAFSCLPGLCTADYSVGADWLESRVQDDGRVVSSESLVSVYQGSVAALEALDYVGRGDSLAVPAIRSYVDLQPFPSAWRLSKRIISVSRETSERDALVSTLLGYQRPDGSFGDRQGYDGTVLDTALALRALAVSGMDPSDSDIARAVDFLLRAQDSGGAWGLTDNDADSFVTSRVMRGLQSYSRFDRVSRALDQARQWLLGQRNQDGGLGEPWRTAAAILAVAPNAPSKAEYSNTVAALRQTQREDGSWGGDVFSTALAVQALSLASRAQPNSSLARLSLQVVDAEYGSPIQGATASVTGPLSRQMSVDDEGNVHFRELKSGRYELSVSATGYMPLKGEVSLDPGEGLDLGSVRMLRASDSGQAILQGAVKDAETGNAISGAEISLSGTETAHAETDVNGQYRIRGVQPGDFKISLTADGYTNTSVNLALEADTVAQFDVTLFPVEEPAVSLIGTVTAADTGVGLSGASVTVSGAVSAETTTNSDGSYRLGGLTAGSLTITAGASGYQSSVAEVVSDDGQTLSFSPELVPEGGAAQPPETGAIQGRVVDASTGEPLDGASVIVEAGSESRAITADGMGQYSAAELPSGTVELTVELAGYATRRVSFELSAGISVALPDIELSGAGSGKNYLEATVVDSISSEPVSGARVKLAVGEWKRIKLSGNYARPVVVARAITHNNELPLSTRIRNVTPFSFEVSLQVPCRSVATCPSIDWEKETVSFIAVEEGVWTLEDGTRVEAHRTSISAIKSNPQVNPGQAVSVNFEHAYSNPPAIIHGVMSENDPAWVVSTVWAGSGSRSRPPGTEAAQIALELGQVATDHASETIGWIAFETGEGTASGLPFASGQSSGAVSAGHDTGCFVIGAPSFGKTAFTFVSQLTRRGGDGGWQRQCGDIGDPAIRTHTEEDQVGDLERRHSEEYAAWVAFGKSGSETVLSPTGEAASFEIGNAELGAPVHPFETVSDENGRFRFENVGAGQGNLFVSADWYKESNKPVYLQYGGNNLGQVRLRPEGALDANPDLAAYGTEGTMTIEGDGVLEYSGSVSARWKNTGLVASETPFRISAFSDHNGNQSLDEEEQELGSVTITESVARAEERTTRIDISGEAAFPGAPVALSLDTNRSLLEADETNNVATSNLDCRTDPPPAADLELALQWKTRGRYAGHDHPAATGPVAVAQMNDDNGDGVINAIDVPDVIMPTGAGGNGNNDTLLAVFSGGTGEMLWGYHGEAGVRVSHRGSPAVGDIDGDGYNEIVTVSYTGRRLLMFEHDGTLTWNVNSMQPTHGGAAHATLIANLDHEGLPEIVVGASVFNHRGELLWTGSGDEGDPHYRSWGSVPVAADIHDTPGTEISAGRTLYASDGTILWHRADIWRDGTTGIGEFDGDADAEIVLVSGGRVILMEHTGETIWDVDLGASGAGGPPTIADFDGDGRPEIGVAGRRRYVVFESDGVTKWTASSYDGSSATGSSVFDFDGDGKAEVLYADEREFRIFDGGTGATLVRMDNSSVTKVEYPLVVDVDRDGGAEILLTSNPRSGPVDGLRVFEAANGQWAPTRTIWNQHSYHISNVADDGSIPVEEAAPWRDHNTWRLNTFSGRDALERADLVASRLELVDRGRDEPAALRVRIGSAGALGSDEGTKVTFYDGDPGLGVELGSVVTRALSPGQWQDVVLEGVDVSTLSGAELFAVADAGHTLQECREDNNRAHTEPLAVSTLGGIQVYSNASSYLVGEDAEVTATITNEGRFPGSFTAALHVEDVAGNEVTDFGSIDTGELSSGESTDLVRSWPTEGLLAGSYRVVATLYNHSGNEVDRDESELSLLAVQEGEPLARLGAYADQAIYPPGATVRIRSLAENITSSGVIDAAGVTVTVTRPDGSKYEERTVSLGDLGPNALREIHHEVGLNNAVEGVWSVTGRLYDASDRLLATAVDQFEVQVSPAVSLQGAVSVLHAERLAGEPQTCTDSLTNTLDRPLEQVEVRRLLLDHEAGEAIGVITQSVSMMAEATEQFVRGIDTSGMETGVYSCVLQVANGADWWTIDAAYFRVEAPPIDMVPNLEVGNRGRLLVLLDPPDAGNGGRGDAHGPKEAPGPQAQRDWLEDRLDATGWSYRIVNDAESFREQLETDQYAVVALLHEHIKIPETVQHDLVDRVASDGIGLFVAGAHDRRNGRIESALGLRSRGKLPHVEGLYLYDSDVATADSFDFFVDDKPLRLELKGASTIGKYVGVPTSDKGGGKGNGKGRGPDKPPGPALTTHEHGNGRSVDAGFDLLVQGAAIGGDNRFGELMLSALEHVHPESLEPVTGFAWPVKATLANQGIATPGRLLVTLPLGSAVVDTGKGSVNAAGEFEWRWALESGESRTLIFWVQLPEQPGPAVFDASVEVGSAPDWQAHRQVQYRLTVEPRH